jgi:hypothetical protein
MSSSPSSSSRASEVAIPHASRVSEAHLRVTALLVMLFWAQVLWRAAERQGGPLPVAAMVAAGLGAQLAFSALEGACAAATWRALGARVGVAPLVARVLVASAAEGFAVAILVGDVGLPDALATVLCGPRAWPDWRPDSGFARAFAATGVLTLVRVALSAHAQARLAGASFARGLAVVGSLHLAARLVLWWASDLLLGRSFQS